MTTSFTCPFCNAVAQAKLVWMDYGFGAQTNTHTVDIPNDAAFRCMNCGRTVGGLTTTTDLRIQDPHLLEFWPTVVGGKGFPDVPSDIAETADEAHRCLSIGAARGAVALARAVVEATAKAKGITSGTLEKKIDTMAKEGVIGPDTAEAAHAVRLWGNDAAHGDLVTEALTRVDAEEVLALMDEVLNRAYQSPARVRRVVESRRARQEGGTGGVPIDQS